MYFKEAIAQPITNNNSTAESSDTKFVKVEKIERAVAFTHLGNYSQVIEIANQMLKQDATNLGGLEAKGVALLYLGKNNAALNNFNTLVSEGHVAPWVLDKRGVILKNYVGAISNFNTDPNIGPEGRVCLVQQSRSIPKFRSLFTTNILTSTVTAATSSDAEAFGCRSTRSQ